MHLIPERSPLPRTLALLYLAIAAMGGVVLQFSHHELLQWARCPLRSNTGVPCFTCGGTHAVVALSRFHLATALRANPLITLGVVTVLAWGLWALLATAIPNLRRDIQLSYKERISLRIFVLTAIAATWIYEILRLT
jgi:hypothetical protein